MKDEEIIELYFKRDERAIEETDYKYGDYCASIADKILKNELDDAFGEDYKTGIYKDGAIIMTFELL